MADKVFVPRPVLERVLERVEVEKERIVRDMLNHATGVERVPVLRGEYKGLGLAETTVRLIIEEMEDEDNG